MSTTHGGTGRGTGHGAGHGAGAGVGVRRDYGPLLTEAMSSASMASHELSHLGASASMRLAVDLLWRAFRTRTPGDGGFSWVGFYMKVPGVDEMVLVCREPKPACSPIGLHGMCGKGLLERRPIVIADVSTLGANYIACDPKDKSELVVPMIAPDGSCPGVLDVDSYDVGAFSSADAAGITELLVTLGLSVPSREHREPMLV